MWLRKWLIADGMGTLSQNSPTGLCSTSWLQKRIHVKRSRSYKIPDTGIVTVP